MHLLQQTLWGVLSISQRRQTIFWPFREHKSVASGWFMYFGLMGVSYKKSRDCKIATRKGYHFLPNGQLGSLSLGKWTVTDDTPSMLFWCQTRGECTCGRSALASRLIKLDLTETHDYFTLFQWTPQLRIFLKTQCPVRLLARNGQGHRVAVPFPSRIIPRISRQTWLGIRSLYYNA